MHLYYIKLQIMGRYLLSFITALLLVFTFNNAYGQAANWPGNNNSGSITPGNNTYSPGTSDIGPGDYNTFLGCGGVEYYFYGCNTGNWDVDYAFFNDATSAYLDYFDGVSACSWRADGDVGTDNRLTPASTTTVRVIMPRYDGTTSSSANSWNWTTGLTCTRLEIKAIPPSAPSTPTGGTTICTGGSATLTRVGSPPGDGVTWYWQTSASGTSTANSGSTYSVSPGSTTTYYLRPRSCHGYWGTASGGVTVTVVADPVAPSITRSPNVATVCEGTTLTVTSSGGSGGTGTCNNEYRYSTNNGGSWTGWSTTLPSFSAVVGTNLIESRRNCTGSGCNSNVNQVSWTVDEDPVISGPTTVCDNTTAGITTSVGSIAVSAGSWSGGTFTPPNIAPPTASQVVTITATNGACTELSSITVYNLPTFTSSGGAMCPGEIRILETDIPSANFSGPGVSGSTFTAPDPGATSANYNITATNGACSVIQTITVFPNTNNTTSNSAMCEGDSRPLSGTPAGGVFTGVGVSGGNFIAPTPAGGAASEVFPIVYNFPGSPCPDTVFIPVYANPSAEVAGDDDTICVNTDYIMGATSPAIGSGTWTWSPSTPNYTGGTSSSDHDAQVNFSAGGIYTGTWTTSNAPCTSMPSDDVVITVTSAANNAYLVSGISVTAVEQCVDSGWTYYATTTNPDEYLFGIRKNGNGFTASVEIVDLPGTTTISSVGGVGPARGTWLIGRYWNANILSGSIGTTVDVRFFVDPAEVTQAQSEATAFLGSSPLATNMTPLTFFKTNGTDFNPGMLNSGNFTFTPTYLPFSTGTKNGVTFYELTGISSFSGGTGGFSVNDDGSSLPVELLSFDAKAIDNQFIELSWSTATEVNNDGFELLRSLDGVNFERVAWIEGNGNSTEINNYSYNDLDVTKGIRYYYQLKQIDFNGDFEIFDVVSAMLEGTQGVEFGNLVPNPSNGKNWISVDVFGYTNNNIQVSIYNNIGMLVKDYSMQVGSENSTIDFDISDVANGSYIVTFKGDFGLKTKKLVVSK